MSSSSSSSSSGFDLSDSSGSENDIDLDIEEPFLTVKTKNKNYFEVVIPNYSEAEFFEHFRLSKNVVDNITERFLQSQYYHHQAGEFGKISASKCVCVFLWFVGHEAASFRDIADRFDISLSSLWKIITRMTYFLSNLSPEIIKWPSPEEKQEISQHFEENGFPGGVVGVIDGTHVRIDKPNNDPDSYYNRKHYYSFQVWFGTFLTDILKMFFIIGSSSV